MTRQLNLPHVRRVVLRADIVMLQNPRCIKVIHVATRALPSGVQRTIIEMPHDALNLRLQSAVLRERGVDGAETAPEAQHDDLRGRPGAVDGGDEVDVALGELRCGDVVDGVGVVGADVDEGDVCGGVRGEVPEGWVVAVEVEGAAARVGGAEPLVGLAVHVVCEDGGS